MTNFLILSAHDYRTPRRANLHFIADEFAKRGKVRFFSLRYSLLSSFKKDFRATLDAEANRVVNYQGVECYLWKTIIHSFSLKKPWLYWLEYMMFKWFQLTVPKQLSVWVKDSDVILLESGLAPIYTQYIRTANPKALLIYKASDTLDAIDAAEFIKRYFTKISHLFDYVSVVSPLMVSSIPYKKNIVHIPHGLERNILDKGEPNPYTATINVVSVGSMLFDPHFFEVASQAFPDVTFHLIGTNSTRSQLYGDNVVMYDHMAYDETLRYIKYANASVAPYVKKEVPAFLADSSMKLLHNDFYGIPSVCPYSVVGSYQNRFGYQPGDDASIKEALSKALASKVQQTRKVLFWDEVADRLLSPYDYPDTNVI